MKYWESTQPWQFKGYQGPRDRQNMETATYKPGRKSALLLSLNIDNLSTTAAGQPVTFKIDVEEDTPGKAPETVVSGWVVSRQSLHIQGVYEFKAGKTYLIKWSFTGKEGRNQYKITVNRFTAGALKVTRVKKVQNL